MTRDIRVLGFNRPRLETSLDRNGFLVIGGTQSRCYPPAWLEERTPLAPRCRWHSDARGQRHFYSRHLPVYLDLAAHAEQAFLHSSSTDAILASVSRRR